MSGKPDLSSKLPPAEPHWPEIRAWLQANPQTLLDDRSLLEEIGLKPHGLRAASYVVEMCSCTYLLFRSVRGYAQQGP